MGDRKKGPGKPRRKSGGDEAWGAVLRKLESSCLGEEHAAKMGLRVDSAEQMGARGLPAGRAFAIPYHGTDGRPTGFERWRYIDDLRDQFQKMAGAKQVRYVQLPGSQTEAYFPPVCDWRKVAADAKIPVVVTEGELKATCVSALVGPCVGLGGVYSFRSARAGQEILPELKAFPWDGREVVVAFDSDSARNPMVAGARNELCRRLTAMGAIVKVATVPDAAGGERQGVDDLAHAAGVDALVECLGSAEPFAPAAALHELNAEVAYVKDPGIVAALGSGLKMRPEAFTGHAYANRFHWEQVEKPDGGVKLVKTPTARSWLQWPRRLELERVTYSPGEERITAARELNTWPGWGVLPAQGDASPWSELLDHLFGPKRAERAWFERWCALPLQRPGTKLFTAAVLWGERTGTGKSSVGYALKRIYGRNFTEIGDAELKDPRNEWAIDKQFVLGDDVTGQEQRKHADRLKAMVTQQEMRLNPKYIPSYTVPDRVNYLFTSNHPDAFFLEDDDRRFFVHEVGAEPLPPAWYRRFKEWRESEAGAAALFHHLLSLDLGGQEPEDRAPDTEARRAMIEDGLSDLGRWVRALRDDPDRVLRLGGVELRGDLWTSADLLRVQDPEGKGRATAGGLGRELKRAGVRQVCGGAPVRTQTAGQARLFAVRNRERWAACDSPAEAARHYDATRGEKAAKYQKQ